MNDNRGAIHMGDEIARQRTIGAGSDGWNTRMMNTMHDASDTPARCTSHKGLPD